MLLYTHVAAVNVKADEMDSYVDEDDEEYEPHECCPCNVELSSYLDDDDDDDD